MFLLRPSDYHSFDIHEKTLFTFLKFNNVYLSGIGNIQVQTNWNQHMDELLMLNSLMDAPILRNEEDAKKTDGLLRLIADEWKETRNETNETIFFLIQATLSIIKRNISSLRTNGAINDRITAIINYIHKNIYHLEMTQADHLGDVFGLSKHYLGIYFKEKTGINLRDYINNYKLNLITNRLKYSSFSIKDICNELGFSDLSHFNKFFKTHTGINPSQYRKELIL
ncbi:HTH-type transcriptional activator RhaR [compost metagenome]